MANIPTNAYCKWWTSQTVAVVTGANKGIGLEIVRQLAENGLTVVLTARDVNRGTKAVKTLKADGLHNVVFRQLDIQNPQSISDFQSWMNDSYGGLDILVNNAGVLGAVAILEVAQSLSLTANADMFGNANYQSVSQTNYEMTKICFETNYYGAKRVTEALLPLFRASPAGARIVNVSSEAGLLEWLNNDSLRRELSDVRNITEELIDEMLQRFLEDVKNGEIEGKGWPYFFPTYSVSKLALNCYARLLHQRLLNSEEGKRICVNTVHPGIVKTDMTMHAGQLTAAEGAESCVMVALLPPSGPSGQFYQLKKLHRF